MPPADSDQPRLLKLFYQIFGSVPLEGPFAPMLTEPIYCIGMQVFHFKRIFSINE